MRHIIKDIIGYVMTGQYSASLQAACVELGEREVRLFCIHLSGWWSRGTLMQSKHPYLSLSPHTSHDMLRNFIEFIPELRVIVRLTEDACHFSDSVTQEERRAINDYAMEHYRPQLFT